MDKTRMKSFVDRIRKVVAWSPIYIVLNFLVKNLLGVLSQNSVGRYNPVVYDQLQHKDKCIPN